ncbi:MAG: PD-(D/E)XK nuclease family protein [Nitrospirae bacterium]|nr:PD-(D/E)XK nuclease family protein [Nitrospirota bacterium]
MAKDSVIKSINVSQLICACIDPKWRKDWIEGKPRNTRCGYTQGGLPVYGTAFHKIAEIYIKWLTSLESKDVAAQSIDDYRLWHNMYDHFAEKKLLELLKKHKLKSVDDLTQSLMSFCNRLVELRKLFPKFTTWNDIFKEHEFAIDNVRFDIGKSAVFISGKVDAIRFNPKHGLEVVDYKLSMGTKSEYDLLQVAIYARLLTIKRPGIDFHACLEYYLPELKANVFSPKKLADIFNDIVDPVLYELVGEQRPSIKKKHTPDKPDSEDLSDGIKKCYADFKLNIEVIDKQDAPQLVRYRVRPYAGVKVDSLVKRAKDLQVQLSLTETPLIKSARGFVTIDILKERPDTVLWRDVIENQEYVANTSPVAFPVGIGIDNQLLIADLAESVTSHVLVAGSTGSGKSEFLKCLVASLIKRNAPHTLKFSIVDPKKVTFASRDSDLSNSAYLTEPIIYDIDTTIDCLQRAVDDMEVRYDMLKDAGFHDLSSYLQTGRQDMAYYVIVMDEFGYIVQSASGQQKLFENLVVRLSAKGRACGIHLVLATQRPDVKIVTGNIKANLLLKVCLKVSSPTNSQIVLGKTGAEVLRGYGDMLCERGGGLERAQSPLITQEEFAAIAALYEGRVSS